MTCNFTGFFHSISVISILCEDNERLFTTEKTSVFWNLLLTGNFESLWMFIVACALIRSKFHDLGEGL